MCSSDLLHALDVPAKLLDQTKEGRVSGVGIDPVEPDFLQEMTADEVDGLGSDPLTPDVALADEDADVGTGVLPVDRPELHVADMAALEDESLDHIARRMRDITRRLGLGRAGPVTRGVQDGVIESLDKLIAKLEEQQDQASGGGGSAGSGNQGEGKPMEDSRVAGARGAGEVTRRDLGDGEGWGNLPPHERERALQQIGREFPPHYREAIEQYFKRLAAGEQTP